MGLDFVHGPVHHSQRQQIVSVAFRGMEPTVFVVTTVTVLVRRRSCPTLCALWTTLLVREPTVLTTGAFGLSIIAVGTVGTLLAIRSIVIEKGAGDAFDALLSRAFISTDDLEIVDSSLVAK